MLYSLVHEADRNTAKGALQANPLQHIACSGVPPALWAEAEGHEKENSWQQRWIGPAAETAPGTTTDSLAISPERHAPQGPWAMLRGRS